MAEVIVLEFDARALFEAMDAKRAARQLSWRGVADQLWSLSSELNARRNDHPISPSTLSGMQKRPATSCQHALFMLRWLDRTPESFLVDATTPRAGAELPSAGPDRRLRWDLRKLYDALDLERRSRATTWPGLASGLRCTPSQLTGLRRARFATNMALAMRIVQWLDRPAADFIYAAEW